MDYFRYFGWQPYVSVAQRRRKAEREAKALAQKGHRLSPVVIAGRTIARSFWGKAWCDNLERYSDFSNRLPRGRTYVRNGSVVDLRISPGEVRALVIGSDLYKVAVSVAALPRKRWNAICADCSGAIDSLVELLQGRFSDGVMARICEKQTGLFPAPAEIRLSCSCPDWAVMCKHVAAVLYGIGARLDREPQLLFNLRQVDESELIARAGKELPLSKKRPGKEKVLADEGLSELFGLELGTAAETPVRKPSRKKAAPPAKVRGRRSSPAATKGRENAAAPKAKEPTAAKPPAARKRKPPRPRA